MLDENDPQLGQGILAQTLQVAAVFVQKCYTQKSLVNG